MSSEHFKNNNITKPDTFPILLDQITFKVPIYTSAKENFRRVDRGQDTRGKHRIEVLGDPIVRYFADPRLYPSNSCNVIYPCGRKVVATGGKRLEMAEQGTPLAHYTSKSPKAIKGRAPQERSIERHEHSENQFTDNELRSLLNNPKCDPDRPYEYLLKTAIAKATELREIVAKQKGVSKFNLGPFGGNAIVRMELYFEIPFVTDDDSAIRNFFEKVLRVAFGSHRLSMLGVKEIEDDQDNEPPFLKWSAPQSLFSTEFNGKRQWFVKLYKKHQRVRIEIQANEPNLKPIVRENLALQSSPNLQKEALIIADNVAKCLKTIEIHMRRELVKLPAQISSDVLFQKMKDRCGTLLKNKADSVHFLKALRHIADHGFIDRKTYRSFGLNQQQLQKLSHPNFGFLEVREKGLVADRASKRMVNPSYILVPEYLDRKGKPNTVTKKATMVTPLLPEAFKHLRSYSDPDPVAELSGSAMPHRKFLIG